MRKTKKQKAASEAQKRAWKTRRKRYGKKGHNSDYGKNKRRKQSR